MNLCKQSRHATAWLFFFSILSLGYCAQSLAADEKPHAVFVVGTHHYSPHVTMPPLAKQLEQAGFRTTVVMPKKDPEHDPAGLPGLEALADADVAIFFMRFLTLPREQLTIIRDYIEAGKPVVGLRTTSHAFDYKAESPLVKWNDFGRRVLGTPYLAHLAGKTDLRTKSPSRLREGREISSGEGHASQTHAGHSHPVLSNINFKNKTAAGSLYLAKLPPEADVLLLGTGEGKKTGTITNRFGTHELQKRMTQPVAWTWKNEWGGRVFGTSLGHLKTFEDPDFVRLFVNAICWASGEPVPAADATIGAIKEGQLVAQSKIPTRQRRNQKRKPDAKNTSTNKPAPPEDPEYVKYAIFEKTAKRPDRAQPSETLLPLKLELGQNDRLHRQHAARSHTALRLSRNTHSPGASDTRLEGSQPLLAWRHASDSAAADELC